MDRPNAAGALLDIEDAQCNAEFIRTVATMHASFVNEGQGCFSLDSPHVNLTETVYNCSEKNVANFLTHVVFATDR